MVDYKSQKAQLCLCDRDYYFNEAIKTLKTLSNSRYDKEYELFMEKYEEKSRRSCDVMDLRDLTLVEDHGTFKRKHPRPFGSLWNNIEKTDKEKQLMRFAMKILKSKLSLQKDVGNKIQQENAHSSFCTAVLGSSLHDNETQQNLNYCTVLSEDVDTETNNSKLKTKKKIGKDMGSACNSVCLKSNASLCWETSRTAQTKDSKLSSIRVPCGFYKKLNNRNITVHSENNQKNNRKNVQGKQVFSRYPLRSTFPKQCFNTSEKVDKLCRKKNCIIKKKEPNVRKCCKISCHKKYFKRNSQSIVDHDESQSLVLADIDRSERKNSAMDNFAEGNNFCSNTSLVINPTSYNRYIKENYPDLILLDMDFDDSMSENFETKMRNEDEAKSTLSQSKKNCYMSQQETNESERDMRNAHIKVLTIDDLPINNMESENTPLHRSCESSLNITGKLQIGSKNSMLENFKFACSNAQPLPQSKKKFCTSQQETNKSESDMRNAHIKVLTTDDLPINTMERENTPLYKSCESSLNVIDELQVSSKNSILEYSKCSYALQLSLSNSFHGLQYKSLFSLSKETRGSSTHCDMYPSSNRTIFLKTWLEKKQLAYSCTSYSQESWNYISSYTKIHNFYERSTDSFDSSSSTQLNSASGRSDLSILRNSQSKCHTDKISQSRNEGRKPYNS